ncbi:MAG: mobA [Rhizobacter sp.]|nr:mobA [Rhizobacter sp.]
MTGATGANGVICAEGTIERSDITGLVLAGGRGSRMGGADKGLVLHAGKPMAQHAVERLRSQVGRVVVNANRNLDRYAAIGCPVWPDTLADFAGPLAGLQAGLAHGDTPYLVTVPCDSPYFPLDLVARLAESLMAGDADIAVAQTIEHNHRQSHPVFLLMRTTLRSSLDLFLGGGGRKIDRWASLHRRVDVHFDDASAFANANSPQELTALKDRPS